MMKHFKNVIHYVCNRVALFLIPALCSYCRKFLSERTIFCVECEGKLFPVVSKQIDITPSFSVTVFALTDYKDPLRRLILAKNWSDNRASYYLGQLIWKMTPISSLDYDLIVPIPLHWTRYASRGFNQAEEIARVIHHKKQVSLVHLLKRVRRTRFQFELASSGRGMNVHKAFALAEKQQKEYAGKHILLVDDVMTTGATIREACKELLRLKPRKITVIVACRVI